MKKLYKNGFKTEDEIEGIKKEINNWLERRGKEIIFNARVKELEEGEKCSRFFFKKCVNRKSLIEKIDEEIEMEGILYKVFEFYDNLFKEKKIDLNVANDFIDLIDKELVEEDKLWLDREINIEEIKTVVFSFANGKSPGIDGLSIEFYIKFWELIKKDFLEVINMIFKNGELTPSQRRGLVTIIHKKGEKDKIKNYRPITLLNADYKIIAKIISNRMKNVIA